MKKSAFIFICFLFQGCTAFLSSQSHFKELRSEVYKSKKDISRLSQMFYENRTKLESFQDQSSLVQGQLDEFSSQLLKIKETHLGKTEENLAENSLEVKLRSFERELVRLHLFFERSQKDHKKGYVLKRFKNTTVLKKVVTNDYKASQYKRVISNSSQVIESKDASSSMRELALLFRGESYFKIHDYKNSALDFMNFIDLHPQSSKLVRAYLIAGDSLAYLKYFKVAQYYYEKCFSLFPETLEGQACSERIKNSQSSK
jgi:TolA-binding protein